MDNKNEKMRNRKPAGKTDTEMDIGRRQSRASVWW
jgi:hypothetical protein